MNDETKKKINKRYEHELNKGERFWPDSIFKDLIVSLGIFILLILLATFVGVAPEAKADPSDTSYIPRPEWYFLFLFKFLALYGQIPVLGKIEWIATVAIPGIAIGVLTLLPFIDKSPNRYYGKRVLPISIMTIMVTGIMLLTLMSEVPTVSADGSKLLRHPASDCWTRDSDHRDDPVVPHVLRLQADDNPRHDLDDKPGRCFDDPHLRDSACTASQACRRRDRSRHHPR